MPDVVVRGEGVPDMKLLAIRLRAAPATLRGQLRRRLQHTGSDLAGTVRRSILGMRAEHSKDRTLREAVAATVYVSVSYPRTGVRVEIVSAGRRMPEGMENLPWDLNRPRGWGHPVFADAGQPRDRWTWVRQWGKIGWFDRPITEAAPGLRQQAEAAIEDVRRELDG